MTSNTLFFEAFRRTLFGERIALVAFARVTAKELESMSDYKVISEVGQSIINVLWQQLQADADLIALISSSNLISLESPAEHQANSSDPTLLSVYLYRITEDPYMKNRGPVEGTGGRLRKPPLSLDLYYLITPLLKAPRDQQIVLGKIMQILYDRSTLEGPDLFGTLADTGEVLRMVFNTVPLQEVSWVWQALETPYRLSLTYSVRVTMLDSTEEQYQQPVLSKTNTYAPKTDLVGVAS